MTEESLKVENTPTHHHRKLDVSGTTQASFLAKFKASNNKLGQNRRPPQCSKDIMSSAIYYKIEITN